MSGYSYDSFHLLFSTDSTYTEINPTYNITIENLTTINDDRAIGGSFNTSILTTNQTRIELPMTFVNSSLKSKIYNDWSNRNELRFVLNLSNSPLSYVCKITNNTEPLGLRSQFTTDEFSGNVFLLTVNGKTAINGGPFILDDAVWGKLDQNYNVLT